MQVICSECGHKFKLKKDGDIFIPSKCPSCNKEIDKVKYSPQSECDTAWVKNG